VPKQSLIACVDDDAAVLEALQGLLPTFGFDVVGFASGEEFLAFAQSEELSCLITDIKLGGMSGLELQQRLSLSGFKIPTIVMTAFADERNRQRALDGGAVDFLSKPISEEGLLAAINSALGVRPRDGGDP
jgi:FixJ family two-component response regulator